LKTGYICASGLNIVATVARGGRELLAVVLGGSSARERDRRRPNAAHWIFSGYPPGGKNVVDIANNLGAPAMDMKPPPPRSAASSPEPM